MQPSDNLIASDGCVSANDTYWANGYRWQ